MTSDLEGLTRRDFLRLSALGGLAVTVGVSSEAEAKPDLPEVTERDFDANVYNAKNPVIVLFHDATPASQRMERVIDALYHQYSDRIDFYRFDVNRFLASYGGNGPVQGRAIMRLTGVPDTYAPKTMMYASFDIVTGKRFEQNVVIDVRKGGPETDEGIGPMFRDMRDYWVRTNILGQPHPEGNTITRYHNTGKLQEVGQLR